MGKNNLVDYHFKQLNDSDYELIFSYTINNQIFQTIFAKSKKVLARKKKIKVDGDLSSIDNFAVPLEFHWQLKQAVKRHVKQVTKEVGKDGIKIVNYDVSKGIYRQLPKLKKWLVDIHITGQFAR